MQDDLPLALNLSFKKTRSIGLGKIHEEFFIFCLSPDIRLVLYRLHF